MEGENLDVVSLAKQVAEELDADILFYHGPINESGFGKLSEAALSGRRRDRVLLILTTNGGSGGSAYKIARFLQTVYSEFWMYAPTYCYSAGTIVALGAHRLYLSPFSELGPLDVQLLKPNELGARKSGLLTRSAFQALADASFELFESFMLRIMGKSGGLIGFRVAAEVSASMTSALMSSVYGKIDPDVVGSDQRDLEVALHYGMRLIDKSKNADPDTLVHLVTQYPSHDFIIDAEEAKTLFHSVQFPSSELMMLAAVCRVQFDDDEGVFVAALTNPENEGEDNEDRDQGIGAEGEQQLAGSEHLGGSRDHDGQGDSGAPATEEANGVAHADPTNQARGTKAGRRPRQSGNALGDQGTG